MTENSSVVFSPPVKLAELKRPPGNMAQSLSQHPKIDLCPLPCHLESRGCPVCSTPNALFTLPPQTSRQENDKETGKEGMMKRNDDNLGNLKAHSTLRLRRQSNPAGPGVRTTVFESSFLQRKPNYLTCDQAHGDGNTWPANLLRPWLRAAADNVASLLAFLYSAC